MKSLLIFGLSLGLSVASPEAIPNAMIIPQHISLTCEVGAAGHVEGKTGCLRGQLCVAEDVCRKVDGELYPQSFQRRSVTLSSPLEKRAFSTDGKCGPSNGNLLCDPNSTAYSGTCCSQYGWCGSGPDYCGTGCSSGCTTSVSSAPASGGTSAPRSDGRCGSAFGGATCDPKGAYGGCCSSYGYCGSTPAHCLPGNGCQNGCTVPSNTITNIASTTQEPVLGSPTATGKATGGAPTTNGTCGAAYGGTICGNWPQGSCCSMYGFCGNTTAHCGQGCQSGPCTGPPVSPAPGPSPAPAAPTPGSIAIVGKSGVPAMHAGLMENGRVFFLDKVENYTQLNLTDGQYAYSSEYDPATNQVVPLGYKTNAFCSGGSYLPDGRVISVGGNAPLTFIDPTVGDGFTGIRYLQRSATNAALNGQSWSEPGNKLNTARWYASVCSMPDGTQVVASGSLNGLDPTVPSNNNPTYEILSSTGVTQGKSINMTILQKNQPYYMYPFMHVLNDGTIFIFVSKSSQVFKVSTNAVVKNLPDLPGDYRTYPNTGGSVMMPLSSANNYLNDIIICGGGAYQDITSPTDPSCGRIQPLSANPTWEMDSMPQGRGMVEGTLLADGTIIWVNGCNSGAQGFGLAKNPTYQALLYDPTQALGKRWQTGATSTIARLYHSVALLLLDGTLMIAGSNPVQMPVLTPVPNQNPSEDYVTEFRVEIYTPPYLQGANAQKRPTNVKLSTTSLTVAKTFTITFTAPANNKAVKVGLYHGGFVTHSVHMNHRLVWLDNTGFKAGSTTQTITVTAPPNHNVAPPLPYVIYVLVDGIPAIGQFVSLA